MNKNQTKFILAGLAFVVGLAALAVTSMTGREHLSGQLFEIVGEKLGIVMEDGETELDAIVLPIPPDETAVPDEFVVPEIEITAEVPSWGSGDAVEDGMSVDLN